MARAGLSTQAVVEAGLAVLDEHGTDGLTLARVAQRSGVATPSLYKHVDGLPALRRLVRLRVAAELADVLRRAVAGKARADAVRSLAYAYRDYVRRFPHRSDFVQVAPASDDQAAQAVAAESVEVVVAVLRGFGLPDPSLVHATRALRAAMHGFAVLEQGRGFGLPLDVDTSYDVLVDLLLAGLTELAAGTAPRAG